MELYQIMKQFSNKNIDELDVTALSDLQISKFRKIQHL